MTISKCIANSQSYLELPEEMILKIISNCALKELLIVRRICVYVTDAIAALKVLWMEKGETLKSEKLQQEFPEIEGEGLRYFIFIEDLKRAEEIALKCTPANKRPALSLIRNYYWEHNNPAEVQRIFDLLTDFETPGYIVLNPVLI